MTITLQKCTDIIRKRQFLVIFPSLQIVSVSFLFSYLSYSDQAVWCSPPLSHVMPFLSAWPFSCFLTICLLCHFLSHYLFFPFLAHSPTRSASVFCVVFTTRPTPSNYHVSLLLSLSIFVKDFQMFLLFLVYAKNEFFFSQLAHFSAL